MSVLLSMTRYSCGLYRSTLTSLSLRKSGTSSMSMLPMSVRLISGLNFPVALVTTMSDMTSPTEIRKSEKSFEASSSDVTSTLVSMVSPMSTCPPRPTVPFSSSFPGMNTENSPSSGIPEAMFIFNPVTLNSSCMTSFVLMSVSEI